MVRVASEEGQENFHAWVKKVLLEGIAELKDVINEADEEAAGSLQVKLSRVATPKSTLPEIVFLDSFLSNSSPLSGLSGYSIRKVVQSEPKNG